MPPEVGPGAPGGKPRRKRWWMLLSADGRHVWLGQGSDPAEEELAALEGRLRDGGISGWLGVGEGDYWDGGTPYAVMEVRPMDPPGGVFGNAVALFLEARRKALEG